MLEKLQVDGLTLHAVFDYKIETPNVYSNSVFDAGCSFFILLHSSVFNRICCIKIYASSGALRLKLGLIFDLDPVITTIGPLQLRYYGLIFATMLGIGFLLWRWQILRGGYSSDLARKFFIWGVQLW